MGKRQLKKLNIVKRNVIQKYCNYYSNSGYDGFSCIIDIYNNRCVPTDRCIDNIDNIGKKKLNMIERKFKLQKLLDNDNTD